MKITQRPGCETLSALIPGFLSNGKAHLQAEDINGWVIDISHCERYGILTTGSWVSMTLSINVKEEISLDDPIEDSELDDGIILQSHITSLNNILQSLELDLNVKGWELVVFDN